jgi:gamma-glutamylaminecyclotransferase
MRVFTYGTLKRGHRLHSHLCGQRFIGEAWTRPEFRLHNCGWYPALVESGDGRAIHGELRDVDEATLDQLDEVEEVGNGLYERRLIPLQPPFDDSPAISYVYLGDVTGLTDCGDEWPLQNEQAEPGDASQTSAV